MGWFLPMLASAAISTVGGMVKRKAANKDASRAMANDIANEERIYQRDRLDFKADQAEGNQQFSDRFLSTRTDAAKAGFNPLTALGTGSIAQGMMAGPTGGQINASGVPALASLDFIDSVTGTINDHASGAYSERQKRTQLENDLMKIQIEKLNGAKVQSAPVVRTRGNAGKTSEAQTELLIEKGDLLQTNPLPFGPEGQPYTNPQRSDAEHGEQRYGDVVQEVAGGINLVSDMWYRRKLNKVAKEYGKPVADKIHEQLTINPAQDLQKLIETETMARPKKSSRPQLRPNYITNDTSGAYRSN